MTDAAINALLPHLEHVQQRGKEWSARCPAHEDTTNSLSVSTGQDGRVLLCCHAGCEAEAILEVLNLPMSALFPPRKATAKDDFAAVYPYHDEEGQLLFECVRLEPKGFRQRRPDPSGRNGWTWNLKDTRRVLYRLPQLRAAIERGETVFFVEGEKDADNLHRFGLAATCNPMGAGKWDKEYSESLRGAKLVLIPDNDDPGRSHVERIAGSLRGIAASLQRLNLPGLPEKGDVSDWLAAGGTKEELLALAAEAPRCLTKPERSEKPAKGRRRGNSDGEEGLSTAQELVLIGRKTERFHSTGENEAMARVPVTRQVNGKPHSHNETWPVRSSAFRQWLTREFYQQTERVPTSQAMEDALRVLEGDCRFEGVGRPLSVRVAGVENDPQTLWIDLTNDLWQAVRVTPAGWEIVADPPILFRRYALGNPQAEPVRGGSLDRLRDFLNIRDENAWVQLVVWLVAALLPDIAHPVLVVHGEQGCAKSTLMRLLSALIDPSKTPLRVEPRDVGEWVQAGQHSLMVTLDNVSKLPPWLSDAICRAVTGEGFSKRQLYTDGEDVIITFRRVIALTGIEVVAQRADLLDRSILLALTPILPDKRRSETEVLKEFETARPALLGALLDTVANVLAILPSVQLARMPRMADFARVGVAVERALHWPDGTFLQAYAANVAAQHEEALEASPFALALRSFMQERSEWTGTATELLAALEPHKSISDAAREWPKTPKSASGQLKRLAPNLRAIGLDYTQHRSGQARYLTIRKIGMADNTDNFASPASPASFPSQNGVTQAVLTMTHADDSSRDASRPFCSHRDADDANDANVPDTSDLGEDYDEDFNDELPVLPAEALPLAQSNLGAFTH